MKNRRITAGGVALTFVVLLSPVGASAGSQLKVPADFPTIQSAVDAASPGDTIKVAAGTYDEQVIIAKNLTLKGVGSNATTIKAPSSLSPGPLDGRRSIVAVLGGSKVAISDLAVAGPGTEPCDSPTSLTEGVLVAQDATLDLRRATVTHIHDTPLVDCPGRFSGLAIRVGNRGPTASPGHATIKDVSISDYGNAGIVVNPDSTATIDHNRITGPGTQTTILPFGVVVVGSVATVTNNTITDNRCDSPTLGGLGCGPDPINQIQVAAIDAVLAGSGTVIADNRLSNNDVGTYLLFSPDCCAVSENTLRNNRYFGDLIQDGDNSVSEDSITGGQVGVGVAADGVDTTGTLDNVSIKKTSVAPTQEFSCCGFTAKVVVVGP